MGCLTGWLGVQGMLRRGLQLDALKEFILSQGASKNVTFQVGLGLRAEGLGRRLNVDVGVGVGVGVGVWGGPSMNATFQVGLGSRV